MALTTRTKEAIKTALAMTIAVGISLTMGWDKPMWTGFAVAFVSLATAGQSLNKATLRMIGTLAGAVAALVIISLSPQDRWLFLILYSLWISLCTYMMGGAKNQYFWNVSGFVCGIICMDGGVNSENAFQIAMLRTQQTGLGILVYGLISALLWPNNSGRKFTATVNELTSTQHQFYRACAAIMRGTGDPDKAESLQLQLLQQKSSLGQLLDAAVADTYDIRVQRQQWRAFQQQVNALTTSMVRWLDDFGGDSAIDYGHLLPGLESFDKTIDLRLSQVEGMLKGQAPEQLRETARLNPDPAALQNLTVFQKAELAVCLNQMKELESLSRSMFETVNNLMEFGQSDAVQPAPAVSGRVFIPDLDRLMSTVRVTATIWLAFLGLIYIEGWPGGAGFLAMATPIGMALAGTPQVSARLLLAPAFTGVLFASVVYIFIMPMLSSYAGLGLLIFLFTFFICYRYSEPNQGLGRAFGLAMFFAIASISNEQSYSFLVVANTALMMPLVFLIVAITAHIPSSPRPEQIFLRLMKRFFRSCDHVFSTREIQAGKHRDGRDARRAAFHARELATLPQKMAGLVPQIDPAKLPGTTTAQLNSMVTSLQSLSERMQTLAEANSQFESLQRVRDFVPGAADWKASVQSTFLKLSTDPTAGDPASYHSRLCSIMAAMEQHIQSQVNALAKGQVSVQDGENFYRLLGAWRGVSEALVAYAGNTKPVKWTPWHEERFT